MPYTREEVLAWLEEKAAYDRVLSVAIEQPDNPPEVYPDDRVYFVRAVSPGGTRRDVAVVCHPKTGEMDHYVWAWTTDDDLGAGYAGQYPHLLDRRVCQDH
jgi:hypothetical protein